jgi:hypothetical protein
MRRFCGGLVAKRTRGPIAPGAALVAAGLLAAAAAPAGATVTPIPSPHTGAGAAGAVRLTVDAAKFSTIGSATFYTGASKILSVPPGGNPVGTGDSGPAPFPLDTGAFLVLSTGDATQADQADVPGVFPDVSDLGPVLSERGSAARDVTVVQIPFTSPLSPAGGPLPACLSFDFRFLSEEYPSRLGSAFTDAFVAELDGSTWSTSNSTISAPNNFAALPGGQPVTIKSTGLATMSPAEAAGTPYGAATAMLHAQVLVPALASPGTHSLLLSLFDHGDLAQDSAVFIDNLALAPSPNSCPTGLTSLGPAVAITGPSVAATVNTPTPTLTGTASGPGAVTARIYAGPMAAGTPLQTLPAARAGNAWSVVAGALAPGQYTAQATQASATPGVNGVSAPTTFTVLQGAAAQPGGGSSSQQQTPGDRDNDGIPDDQDTSDGSLPPIPGKTFDARVVSGDVFIKYPAGAGPRAAIKPPKGFVALQGAANVPMGAQLDTRRGRVAVTSAADTGASKTQTADFYDGIFQVKQATPKKKPKKATALITDLVLKGEPPRSECAPLKGSASAAAAKKKKRGAKSVLGSLWGNGKGKFRTNGKYSSATVRGTIWLTQDRCDGTLTTVKRGTVTVRDLKRRRTVTVKAGHSYLARAARGATKAKGATK